MVTERPVWAAVPERKPTVRPRSTTITAISQTGVCLRKNTGNATRTCAARHATSDDNRDRHPQAADRARRDLDPLERSQARHADSWLGLLVRRAVARAHNMVRITRATKKRKELPDVLSLKQAPQITAS